MPLHGRRRWSPPTWPLHACTVSSPGPRRTGLFHGAPMKTHGATRWDGSSLSPRNLTLLARAADSTEEDGRRRGCGASSLQNLP
jgi:hypothetical protein